MIAVASFRPLDQNEEYARNQLAAKRSWEAAFDAVVYFNEPDGRLASVNTAFIPWEPYPRIKDMLEFLGKQSEFGCLINADIVVSKKMRFIANILKQQQALGAFSYRYEYTDLSKLHESRLVDNGLDFFGATPTVWRRAAQECPEDFRIGHQLFDTWIWCFLKGHCGHRCWDITPSKVIFHPKHGGRKFEHAILNHKDNPWFRHTRTVTQQLRV